VDKTLEELGQEGSHWVDNRKEEGKHYWVNNRKEEGTSLVGKGRCRVDRDKVGREDKERCWIEWSKNRFSQR